ncbi:Hsp70 family protein [Micromonospora sp. WMMA1923]|uniref:Hsp70 family protein n=1 Tax=Micromonospora sp. WMMA1923 TaxID=3404125 RepID=UPI003B938728
MIASIDFGASATKAAVLDATTDAARLIAFDATNHLPTAVHRHRGGKLLVGRPALAYLDRRPHQVRTDLKQRLNHATVVRANNPLVEVGGARPMPLLEAVAAVLAHAYRAVESSLSGPPGQLLLTYPVIWDAARRAALRQAARLGGIEARIELVSEPEAAAWQLSATHDRLPTPIAMLDLGASTFDLAVLDRDSDGRLGRLHADGRAVGGDDFDVALLDLVEDGLTGAARRRFVELRTEAAHDVTREAQAVKIRLTVEPRATFAFRDVEREISREEFDEAVAPLVEECVETAAQAVETVHRTRPVRTVGLCGAASRVPYFRDEVAALARRLGAGFVEVGGPGGGPARVAAVALGAVRVAHRPVLRSDDDWVVNFDKFPRVPPLTPTADGFAYPTTDAADIGLSRPGGNRLAAKVGNITSLTRVWRLAYDLDQRLLVSGSDNGLVELWEHGEELTLRHRGFLGRSASVLGFFRDQEVTALAVRGDRIASVEKRGTGAVYRRKGNRWSLHHRLNLTGPTVGLSILARDGALLRWGGERLELLDPDSGHTLATEKLPTQDPVIRVEPRHGWAYLRSADLLAAYRIDGRSIRAGFRREIAGTGALCCGTYASRPLVLTVAPAESAVLALDGCTGAELARLDVPDPGEVSQLTPTAWPDRFFVAIGNEVRFLTLTGGPR